MNQGILAEIEVPGGWRWERLWNAAPRVQMVGQPDAEPLSVFLQTGVVPRSTRSDNHNQLGEDLSKYQIVHAGDIVFNKLRTWQGGLGVSAYYGIVSPAYFVCRPGGDWHPRYLHYLLLSSAYLAELTRLSKFMPPSQFDIPWEVLRTLPLLRPPLDEQRRIAGFLDAETARIDGLAAARERMRDLLVLKRERMAEQILGLDSGPTMIPLKYEVQSVSVGIVITPANWYVDSGGVIALRGLNVSPGRIDTSDIVEISHIGHRENMKSRLSAGDVVVVRTGQAGAAALIPKELDGCNCIDLLIIRPGRSTSPSFLAHYLNSFYARDKITEYSVGSIQSHFNVGSMKNLGFPLIEPKEQERRASALDEAAGDLNLLDLQLETQLAVLGERRQALIAAAVTGQIDVATARGLALDGGNAV